LGAKAACLLRLGYSLGQTASSLSQKTQAPLDLQPLISALDRGGFIKAVNGTTVCRLTASRPLELSQRAQWLGIQFRKNAVRLALHCLPVSASRNLLEAVRPHWPRAARQSCLKSAARNMKSVLGGSLPAAAIESLSRQSVQEQMRSSFDIQLLAAVPEYKMAKWLRRQTTFHGLAYLDAALEAGKGVLLCGMHFSSCYLLPALLWLRGYSFTGLGGIMLSGRHRVLPFNNPALKARLGGCGEVTWNTRFSLANTLGICRTLNQGGMGLVYPDGIFQRPKGEVAEYFGHHAANYDRAHVQTPFFDVTVEANTGAAWMYQQSEAALIPIKMIRPEPGCFEVIVGRELKIDRSLSLSQITAEIYRHLEREVAITPAMWGYWASLHKFSTLDQAVPELEKPLPLTAGDSIKKGGENTNGKQD
jgi:lauroyl/myristoyl acyltransferase